MLHLLGKGCMHFCYMRRTYYMATLFKTVFIDSDQEKRKKAEEKKQRKLENERKGEVVQKVRIMKIGRPNYSDRLTIQD